ncbi:tRNA (adenosine(37)-N6)-threonylcarbamoyltransferase complex dimerization subunit type 1 TsaB [Schinkia azotoformans]|uniref:tRNA (adenosine(37)-N6)-threonylcarbamoyltransferase complex dimerization subunit type 1 TsaB n=1 Tax=Schinkia azotoformans TaxID=1454 RepID=UPI002DBF2BAC|nr:tRNA (adenosine(37)-N6)-threonylcarbamoyltransferase complex dimerization subunit type 1 TsaB [Schinkia azotoformans]MEC1722521.1 tRNA (adenosine(37)-N6)-threonylcarbamoyltransferase complex dimerization subunit type 1 TsaB [Schinkia azotoformans]MED4415493.1 tRNA (adenosine(37)-N6)-threonylcarbamoyltransferase complex dimerization subunit type 1 TsaB [Schinkia azotoformans]
MKALAIDTSNQIMGVAVIDGTTILGEYITNLSKNHSVRLMPAISDLMKEVGVEPKQLERIIVAHGPGSYTGVRIGVTIAKTLAWTLNIPIVGVSSLEVLARNGQHFNGVVSPLFDARRGQVYTGLYKMNSDKFQSINEDQIIMLKDWVAELKQQDEKVLFVGNDVPIHESVIKEVLQDQAIIASPSLFNPRPSELAIIGIEKEPQEVHAFAPNYIRLAEAEAKWIEAQKQG